MADQLDVRCVRVFQEVARHKGFSRAAEVLCVSQPAVTKAVRRLETQLGIRLFDRIGRGSRLSLAGEALVDLVAPLLADWQQVPARLTERLTRLSRGPVRIGAGEGGALYLLPDPIRRLRQRYPEVEVVVRNQPSHDTIALLRAGEVDIGLCALASAPPDLDYRPCLAFERTLIAPPTHPLLKTRRLTIERLAAHPFVMPWPQANARRVVESKLAAKGLHCRVALEAGGWEVVKRYVALGVGIAIVPACCLTKTDRRVLGSRSVRAIFGQDVYGILLRRNHALPRAAEELVRILESGRKHRT